MVLGLGVAGGLPLFCDVTVISPITRDGRPRPGTSNTGGNLLREAQRVNDNTYNVVLNSGLDALYCLGFETYGRWGDQCIDLLLALAKEKSRNTNSHVRRSTEIALINRWSGTIAVAVQNAVSIASLRSEGSDLASFAWEPALPLSAL